MATRWSKAEPFRRLLKVSKQKKPNAVRYPECPGTPERHKKLMGYCGTMIRQVFLRLKSIDDETKEQSVLLIL